MRTSLKWIFLLIVLPCALLLAAGYGYSNLILFPGRLDEEAGVRFFKFRHPGEVGIPFEEQFLTTSDGKKVRCWWMRHPSGPGSGTLWVQHGHGVNMQKKIRYLPFLWKAGYSLFMLEWRNHGKSDPAMTTFGAHEIRDVAAGVDFLKKQLAHDEPLGALAMSMGGAILLRYQGEHPVFHAMVIEGAYADPAEQIYSYGKKLYGVPRFPLGVLATALAEWRGGFHFAEQSPRRWVGAIQAPVLFIHGLADQKVDPRCEEELFQLKPEPRFEWRVTDATHVMALEAAPTEYPRRVLEFFSKNLR